MPAPPFFRSSLTSSTTMIDLISRNRVVMGWVVALAVIYLAVPTPRSLLAGLPLALIGLAVRGIAAGTIRKGTVLTKTGIYACTRNPLYLGSALLAIAFSIMSGSLWAATLLLFSSAIVYPPVIHREESELRSRFGQDFDAFRSSVPCFIPRSISLGVVRVFSFRQFMTNREYNATLGCLAAIGILLGKYLMQAR